MLGLNSGHQTNTRHVICSSALPRKIMRALRLNGFSVAPSFLTDLFTCVSLASTPRCKVERVDCGPQLVLKCNPGIVGEIVMLDPNRPKTSRFPVWAGHAKSRRISSSALVAHCMAPPKLRRARGKCNGRASPRSCSVVSFCLEKLSAKLLHKKVRCRTGPPQMRVDRHQRLKYVNCQLHHPG